jgi:hypothetical protein
MGNYLPEDRCFAMWDYMFTVVAREQNFGAGGPGTGTNPMGRLQTVAMVGKSTWPNFSTFPFVGLQFRNFTEEPYGAKRYHKFEAFFDIVVVVQVQTVGENILQLEDAWSALRLIVNDGNGNGVFPILRDAANYNMGVSVNGQANAESSHISDLAFAWDEAPAGAGTMFVAFATATLQAEFTQQA